MNDELVIVPGHVRGDEEAALIDELDQELMVRYRGTPGEAFSDVDPTHSEHFTEPTGTFLVARLDDVAIGCGGIRRVDNATAEIKRMYVRPDMRGRGIARELLAALEAWAIERGYTRIILESGTAQPDACALYESSGYDRIERYGVWKDSSESICYARDLVAT